MDIEKCKPNLPEKPYLVKIIERHTGTLCQVTARTSCSWGLFFITRQSNIENHLR